DSNLQFRYSSRERRTSLHPRSLPENISKRFRPPKRVCADFWRPLRYVYELRSVSKGTCRACSASCGRSLNPVVGSPLLSTGQCTHSIQFVSPESRSLKIGPQKRRRVREARNRATLRIDAHSPPMHETK